MSSRNKNRLEEYYERNDRRFWTSREGVASNDIKKVDLPCSSELPGSSPYSEVTDVLRSGKVSSTAYNADEFFKHVDANLKAQDYSQRFPDRSGKEVYSKSYRPNFPFAGEVHHIYPKASFPEVAIDAENFLPTERGKVDVGTKETAHTQLHRATDNVLYRETALPRDLTPEGNAALVRELNFHIPSNQVPLEKVNEKLDDYWTRHRNEHHRHADEACSICYEREQSEREREERERAEREAADRDAERKLADLEREEIRIRQEERYREADDRRETERVEREAAERKEAEREAAERAQREADERAQRESDERRDAERNERETAERVEREASDRADQEAAERKETERAEQEAAEEKRREQTEREATDREARERAEHQAAERENKERAEGEEVERAEREAAERHEAERAEQEAAEQKQAEQAEREAAENADAEKTTKEATEATEIDPADSSSESVAEKGGVAETAAGFDGGPAHFGFSRD